MIVRWIRYQSKASILKKNPTKPAILRYLLQSPKQITESDFSPRYTSPL